MYQRNGTPKTLKEAIQNGLEQAQAAAQYGGEHCGADIVALHVRDFLAQKFNPELMDDAKVADLWKRIVEKRAA